MEHRTIVLGPGEAEPDVTLSRPAYDIYGAVNTGEPLVIAAREEAQWIARELDNFSQ